MVAGYMARWLGAPMAAHVTVRFVWFVWFVWSCLVCWSVDCLVLVRG